MALRESLWDYAQFGVGERSVVTMVLGLDIDICVVFFR